jgi:hypothetical protein
MQDRYRRIDEILLRRMAGPYIGSNAVVECDVFRITSIMEYFA